MFQRFSFTFMIVITALASKNLCNAFVMNPSPALVSVSSTKKATQTQTQLKMMELVDPSYNLAIGKRPLHIHLIIICLQ